MERSRTSVSILTITRVTYSLLYQVQYTCSQTSKKKRNREIIEKNLIAWWVPTLHPNLSVELTVNKRVKHVGIQIIQRHVVDVDVAVSIIFNKPVSSAILVLLPVASRVVTTVDTSCKSAKKTDMRTPYLVETALRTFHKSAPARH